MKKSNNPLSKTLELRHDFYLESARFLPFLPKQHPCSKIHGHSFKVTLCLRGELDPKKGWLMDYHELKKQAGVHLSKLDHQLLNKIKGLENPTTELLCIWIYKNLKKNIPLLYQVRIKETEPTECVYPLHRGFDPL